MVGLAGCGSARKGSLSGKVTYHGQPVVSGTVKIVGTNGEMIAASLGADGVFKAAHAPTGAVKVGVEVMDSVRLTAMKRAPAPPRGVTPIVTAGAPAPAFKVVAIPPQYRDPASSGLQFVIENGQDTLDIDLR
jgi:hypothetical protein